MNGAQTPNGTARGGKLTEIRLAVGFLTILPVLPRADVTPETLAASFGWFPLVGFALGALLAAENLLLTTLFGDALAAVVLVLTLTVLTGAVHLDALADTADALGAGSGPSPRAGDYARQPDRQLRHGRDLLFSRARDRGAGDDGRSAPHRGAVACAGPGALGDGGGWMAYRLSARRGRRNVAGGTGGDRNLVLAGAIAALAALPILSWRVLSAYAVAAALAAVLRAAYRRWLGGVTGDLLGAAGELVEAGGAARDGGYLTRIG